MSTRLDGKALIVTGAAQGLGRSYALAAAQAGGSVVVHDMNADGARAVTDEIRNSGGRAVAFAGSVSSWDDSRRVVETCIAEFGTLDGFVANAAIMHMARPWEEEEQRLRAITDVNILGVQFSARHALKAMVEAGNGGSLVTVVSGAQFGINGMSAYGASKGAVNSMTLNWAVEGSPHGVRVNAVSPWAMTPMTAEHLDESQVADPTAFPSPESIAPVVVSLLSDATAGITGKLIRFDGTALSAYDHVRTPLGERTAWTADDVTRALTGEFAPLA